MQPVSKMRFKQCRHFYQMCRAAIHSYQFYIAVHYINGYHHCISIGPLHIHVIHINVYKCVSQYKRCQTSAYCAMKSCVYIYFQLAHHTLCTIHFCTITLCTMPNASSVPCIRERESVPYRESTHLNSPRCITGRDVRDSTAGWHPCYLQSVFV